MFTLTLGMLWYHNPGQRLNCGVEGDGLRVQITSNL